MGGLLSCPPRMTQARVNGNAPGGRGHAAQWLRRPLTEVNTACNIPMWGVGTQGWGPDKNEGNA